jgi:hypothetical protein
MVIFPTNLSYLFILSLTLLATALKVPEGQAPGTYNRPRSGGALLSRDFSQSVRCGCGVDLSAKDCDRAVQGLKDLVLPHDSGLIGPGEYIYSVSGGGRRRAHMQLPQGGRPQDSLRSLGSQRIRKRGGWIS